MASVMIAPGMQKSKKTFQCTYKDCLKKFSTSSHLKRHENVHTNKIYRCDECDAIFSTQYNQKRHIDNKHLKKNPKKFKCDYCEEDFNEKSWLTRHVYRHTGILPYACTFEDCKSRFLMPSRLKRHLKSHEGYSCPKENCSEKFAKWTDVTNHLSTVHPIGLLCLRKNLQNQGNSKNHLKHGENAVYKCPECDQTFSRSSNLNAHSMTHKSDSERPVFLCPKKGCHRSYFTKSNLRHHVRTYHGKRPFNCTIEQCCKFFKSQEQLDKHISRHTPSKQLKKEILDDLISRHRSSRQIKEDLDEHISRQSSSEEIKEDDIDENISRQSSSGQIKKEDLDDHIVTHSLLGQLKNVTVIYLNKDSKC